MRKHRLYLFHRRLLTDLLTGPLEAAHVTSRFTLDLVFRRGRSAADDTRCEVVGGHRNLPAGGKQTLPTHGHLVTQGAGGGGHDSPAGAALDRHIWASAVSPRSFTLRCVVVFGALISG